MRLLCVGWITLALLGQEPPQARVAALMETSVEQQLAAVRKQTPSPAGAFFVLPAFLLPPPDSLGAPLVAAADAGCAVLSEAELMPLAAEAAQVSGIKPEWLLAVVRDKSQGRPCALSPAGAAGLMQLAPATLETLHVNDPFDPRENLAVGARLIAHLVALHHGDFAPAQAAYDGNIAGQAQSTLASRTAQPANPAAGPKSAFSGR